MFDGAYARFGAYQEYGLDTLTHNWVFWTLIALAVIALAVAIRWGLAWMLALSD